jgi:hypothetical protein
LSSMGEIARILARIAPDGLSVPLTVSLMAI